MDLPQLRYRGSHIPPEVWDMVCTKKISHTELVLAVLIDALVDSRGEGCWATNETLASMIGLKSDTHVSELIKHLKKIGLVKFVGWKRMHNGSYRVLETSWSRIEDSHKETLIQTTNKTGGCGKKERGTSGKSQEGTSGKSQEGTSGKSQANKHDNKSSSKVDVGTATLSNSSKKTSTSKVVTEKAVPATKKPKYTFELEWSERLRDAVAKRHRIKNMPWNVYSWASAIQSVLKNMDNDCERMNAAITFYETNVTNRDIPLPKFSYPKNVQRDFIWIEDKMEQQQPKKKGRMVRDEGLERVDTILPNGNTLTTHKRKETFHYEELEETQADNGDRYMRPKSKD